MRTTSGECDGSPGTFETTWGNLSFQPPNNRDVRSDVVRVNLDLNLVMSSRQSWRKRKKQLWDMLDLENPEDGDEGHAVDTHFLQQEALQHKEMMSAFNEIRFTNRDLSNFGALAHGPFGSVDMVRCKLDNKLYVRKSVEKKVVTRNPSQCYPHHEREILLAASLLNSPWAPHLICTFQNHTNLCYVMDFAEGGSLGDLLETSGQISEKDLKWWLPQMVEAVHWCHSQGYCHRDVKPANFVVTSTGHLLLIDFASSARLLPPDSDGVQLVPKESCMVLCGTCDYISPEILAMQEDALVALDDQEEIFIPRGEGGYGRETDWWSLGVTIYELVYGVAPFFAKDVRGTYDLIINHESKLRFPAGNVSSGCISFMAGLLRTATQRLGRKHVEEIKSHQFFSDISWTRLHSATQPTGLQLPQFEYDLPAHSILDDDHDESFSKGYAFSAFFNSSVSSNGTDPNAAHVTFARRPSPRPPSPKGNGTVPHHLSQYVGFTWGPRIDAFDHPLKSPFTPPHRPSFHTPAPTSKNLNPRAQLHSLQSGPFSAPAQTTTQRPLSALVTPIRPSSMSGPSHPPSTIRRTAGGTARKVGTTRAMSEVEALRQMGDCVRASARKRLSHHAGRTPGPGSSGAMSSGVRRRASWVRMTLDFENVEGPRRDEDDEQPRSGHSRMAFNPSDGGKAATEDKSARGDDPGLRIFVKDRVSRPVGGHVRRKSSGGSFKGFRVAGGGKDDEYADQSTGGILFGTVMKSDDDTTTTDDAPPSPSPSPRPLSAMSRPTSSLSRRGLNAVQPFSSGSISAGGLAGISIKASSARIKTQRPTSFSSTSKGRSSPGVQSALPSTDVPAEEPIAIFKPLPPSSRSASGSSSNSALQVLQKSNARFGGLRRIIAEDGDADATPKAKQQPSSSRPIFVPPTLTLREGPRSSKQAVVRGNQAGPLHVNVESIKERQSSAAHSDLAFPLAHPSAEIPIHGARPVPVRPSSSSKFADMEERLRVMMRDIEHVETELEAARNRLET